MHFGNEANKVFLYTSRHRSANILNTNIAFPSTKPYSFSEICIFFLIRINNAFKIRLSLQYTNG